MYYQDQPPFRKGAAANDVYVFWSGKTEMFKKRDGLQVSLSLLDANTTLVRRRWSQTSCAPPAP